jgi:gas vesicle protein GvpA/GvpJ/GvpM family
MSPGLPQHSTVPAGKPAKRPATPRPPKRKRAPLPASVPKPKLTQRGVGRIIDQSEMSLVDVIDNLLTRGVVLNADLILALANVDLVYVRLSALLCAADRVLPSGRR